MISSHLQLTVYDNGDSEFGRSVSITKEECSTKLDLGEIICPKANRGSKCILHSRFGSRIDSCNDIKTGDAIFIVPLGRLFIWPTFFVGHIARVTHISLSSTVENNYGSSTNNKEHDTIEIETISMEPKIFKIRNFFSTSGQQRWITRFMLPAVTQVAVVFVHRFTGLIRKAMPGARLLQWRWVHAMERRRRH